eukprot:COSAG02_NODE_2304_length_9182_cov_12.195530_5_plen_179_part_00
MLHVWPARSVDSHRECFSSGILCREQYMYSEVSPVRFRPSCSSKKSLKTHFPAIHTVTTWYMHILYIQLHNDRQSSSSTNVPQCTRGYIATEATNTVVKVRISAYTVFCGRIMYSNTCTVYLLHIIVPYISSSLVVAGTGRGCLCASGARRSTVWFFSITKGRGTWSTLNLCSRSYRP